MTTQPMTLEEHTKQLTDGLNRLHVDLQLVHWDLMVTIVFVFCLLLIVMFRREW
jgi:hypothetical protein